MLPDHLIDALEDPESQASQDLAAIAKHWQGAHAWSRSEESRKFYEDAKTHASFLDGVDRKYALCQEIIDAVS